MPSHFPTQPAELTASWLSQTLGYEIHDFDVQPFAEGAGIIGQVVRVQLDGRQPFGSLVAKFPSPSEANRAVAHTYDMYGREIGFYRTIANQVSIRTPKCYFADFDDSTQNFVLLMEDLRDFEIGDQVKGCSLENACQIISSTARLHASAWQPDHLNLVSHNNPAQRDGMIAGFNMGWPAVVNAFRDLIPDAAMRAGDKMASATPWLLQEICAPPVCLAHADVRLDNVFFGAGEIALVDWQSVCTSAPEQDLAYFLTQSVPLESVLHMTSKASTTKNFAPTASTIHEQPSSADTRSRPSTCSITRSSSLARSTLVTNADRRSRALSLTAVSHRSMRWALSTCYETPCGRRYSFGSLTDAHSQGLCPRTLRTRAGCRLARSN